MTNLLRRGKRAPRYVLLSQTNHWRIVDGAFYRDCIVRMADGQRRVLAIRDDLVVAA